MTTPRSRPVFFVKRLDTRPHLDVALVDDERNPVNLAGATITGLSPRVRGNRPLRSLDLRVSGSIPACAGEPLTRTTKCARSTVYPRVCGGTTSCPQMQMPTDGLSPRVRGNPSWYGKRPPPTRSIPACAGEPSPVNLGNRSLHWQSPHTHTFMVSA